MMQSKVAITVGPLFVDMLQQVGELNKAEFSFAMNGVGYDSYIDFGKPILSRTCGDLCFDTPDEVVLNFNKDFYWSASLQGIAFNGTGNETYYLENDFAIFDSGSPHLTVPSSLYDHILKSIADAAGGQQYITKEGVTYIDCYEVGSFKPIHVMVNGYWIEIDPYDYIWDVNFDGSVCILMVVKHPYNFWIMGQPLYQGYYTHHDMERSTIGFSALFDGFKQAPQKGKVPTTMFSNPKEEGGCGIVCILTAPFRFIWWLVTLPFKILLWIIPGI